MTWQTAEAVRAKVLELIANGNTIEQAGKAAGVSRSTAYRIANPKPAPPQKVRMKVMRITKERTERGWSKSELARRAGMHSTTISQIELQHQIPSGNQLAKLATALGLPVDEASSLLLPPALDETARLGHDGDEMKKAKAETDKTAVLLRLSPQELARLDTLAEKLVARMPMASRTGIAHAAMLIGLADIERDPATLLPKP